MRTTITLDDDIAAKLRSEMRESGRTFKETVNGLLRQGLNSRRGLSHTRKFVVRARALNARRGVNFDNIGELLEHLEGSAHR